MLDAPKITVVGSANVDFVIRSERFPESGETILGQDFAQYVGGKGANQAVAAARLGAEVSLIAAVGQDVHGELIRVQMAKEKIDMAGLLQTQKAPTGIASIAVTKEDNKITVIPGANHELTPAYIHEKESIISNSDIIIIQLEIPLEVVRTVLEIAQKHRIPTILNPAPATVLNDEDLEKVTYLTPNISELEELTKECKLDGTDINREFDYLFSKKIENIIVTRGKDGVSFRSRKEQDIHHIQGIAVKPVDTTGAGDTFNGALAFALIRFKDMEKAIVFANTAAAISVTKHGAQTGMPSFTEVEECVTKTNKLQRGVSL
ncbi:ribokinase [Planococcus sp. X10-3]|uniref:ribokinase n=1 Tax=Planococcus sp. X10-3 TaxID=3061240 RepID=UPI003BB0CBE9